jgi:hypothetical protein
MIGRGHQAIFDTIYKGSTVRLEVVGLRPIASNVILAHIKSALRAPAGPLAGEHNSLFTAVLVQDQQEWIIAAFHNTLIT